MKKRYLHESARKTPVLSETDVLVVGGGPAGIAAAVSAAREGVRTILLERYGYLGGNATSANVATICGLLLKNRFGKPVPVIKGIAWEIFEKLKKLKAVSRPQAVGESFLLAFDNNRLKDVADEMVVKAGINVFYHTLATEAIVDKQKVRGVIIESKKGREAILSKIVVDASGDADIAASAGAPYRKEDDRRMQFPTMIFKMSNVRTDKAGKLPREEFQKKLRNAAAKGVYHLPRTSGGFRFTPVPGEVVCNITRVSRDGLSLDGTNISDLTYAEIEGRKQIREYEAFFRKKIPGFEKAVISQSGPMIGIRETRLVDGEYTLTKDDVLNGGKFKDAIMRSAWPIELHGGDRETQWLWLSPGNYYEVPYRCLLPLSVENLLVAGRCISATHEAQASVRVIACCLGTGQAAGTAAAMAIRKKIGPRELKPSELQKKLRRAGCLI